MARRKSSEPLLKVTMNVIASDYERLGDLYPALHKSQVINSIIRNHIAKVDRRAAEAVEGLVAEIDIDLESIDE